MTNRSIRPKYEWLNAIPSTRSQQNKNEYVATTTQIEGVASPTTTPTIKEPPSAAVGCHTMKTSSLFPIPVFVHDPWQQLPSAIVIMQHIV